MNRSARYLLLFIVAAGALAAGAGALVHFGMLKRQAIHQSDLSSKTGGHTVDPNLWARSLEKVKEDRGDTGNIAIEIPAQLRHYSDRHWFLATQVAEVKKLSVERCQDFVDLAAMIERGEVVPMPAVTDTYILFGVGARVDGGVFTRYVANQNIELNDEAGLLGAYARLESAHGKLQKDISGLQTQLAALKKSDSTKQDELQEEITARQRELKSNDEEKARLDRYYGRWSGSPESRQRLLRDYESLQTLAKNFGGRSFNLDDSSDRQTLKVYLLSSLRPQALKILEEIAKEYHDKFARPLPVSSLTRPEQYQRALRRVNRYAVLIDTPPHSTGLAFDIDYRYMSGAEQNFLMTKLARLKDDGRIEVIRERGANYHVFAFIDGTRPSDELITASLEDAGGPDTETNHEKTPANARTKSLSAKKRK
jgi:peroxiredoxin family protein